MRTRDLSFESSIVQGIFNSISMYAERNAFCIDDVFFTYKDFGGIIANVITRLREVNCQDDKIGVVINDDIQTYASIIALWMEGRCYVPLHPNWPIERCEDIIDQVGISVILDSSPSSRYRDITVIFTGQIEKRNVFLLDYRRGIPDSALAYILFTSGSTGRPKGVQISRQNVSAFMDSFWKTGIIITEEDRCLQCFDLSFDVSVQSYLVALTRGACVYTVSYGQMKFLSIARLIEDYQITFGAIAPSTLRYLQPYFCELDFSSFRQCIITAEAGQIDLVEDWLKYAVNTQVYDFYGPTEGTVYATYYKLRVDGRSKAYNGIISIGKPLANVTALILDENGQILPPGDKGELCIAGLQVSPGYWEDEEKNRKAFTDFCLNGEMIRLYHTGDLCWIDNEGDIMYSGRIDNQAKIQGFRVELSEIEFHAHSYLNGLNVICVAFQNEKRLDEIALFVESSEFDTGLLIDYLRSKMPAYMVPTKVLFMDSFPLNTNGKIDRKSIKQMIKI